MDIKGIKLSTLVAKGKKVHFAFYRDREFWYKHEDGLVFPVPLSDVDDASSRATLLAEDKAIFFMRWIRKFLAATAAAEAAAGSM